jgi:hypothetical protein
VVEKAHQRVAIFPRESIDLKREDLAEFDESAADLFEALPNQNGPVDRQTTEPAYQRLPELAEGDQENSKEPPEIIEDGVAVRHVGQDGCYARPDAA